MFLTEDEVARLTGKNRRAQQKQVLEAAVIRYFENGIGELIVSRAHVEHKLGGTEEVSWTATGPNFDSLRKAS